MRSSVPSPATVFWPLDRAQTSGFCYGWKVPTYCVAGVLDVNTQEEAAHVLDSACNASAWRAAGGACKGDPEILAYCKYQSQENRLVITSWKTQPTFIFYYRHPLNSLRFYAWDTSLFAPPSVNEDSSLVYDQLEHHDFTRPSRPHLKTALNRVTLIQFNASKLLECIVADSTVSLLPATASVLFSISTLTTLFARPIHTASRLVGMLVNLPVSPFSSLKDVCAVAQQIEVRADQAKYFVTEVPHLRNRGGSDIMDYAVHYTQFFNTIWMILNDITIGMAFGSFLMENAPGLAALTNVAVGKYLSHNIIFVLRWLDSWPAGLKLNTELSLFYSRSFIGIVRLWERGLGYIIPYTKDIVYAVGLMSTFGGMSLAMSAILDSVAVVTLHIYACYYSSGLIYHWMLKTAGSLFNLFRGKRYNVLRNRVDSWEYDIDQLLFGTILFTLLAFLFPTVLVYYALFAVARFATLLLLASMEILLTLVNHFPLFALMLRVKDPWRLSGGVYFRLKTFGRQGAVRENLVIENQPLPLSLLFFQYTELLKALARHYNPLRLAWCLLKGEYLGAISRSEMRYKMGQQI